jgi:hypothetical protein
VDPSRQAQAAAAHTYDIKDNFTGEFLALVSRLFWSVSGGSSNVLVDQTLPYGMRASIYNGLLSSNLITLPTPPFNCPTGNCTWIHLARWLSGHIAWTLQVM